MTGWLLDRNIFSELRRPKPERKVLAFIAAHPLERLYTSTVTFAEIRYNIELVADASRRAELNDWLAHKMRPMFEERVLPVTEDVMFKGRLLGRGRPQGRPYLLAARFDYRGDGAVPRADHPHPRYER